VKVDFGHTKNSFNLVIVENKGAKFSRQNLKSVNNFRMYDLLWFLRFFYPFVSFKLQMLDIF